jgi:hypothetical protein
MRPQTQTNPKEATKKVGKEEEEEEGRGSYVILSLPKRTKEAQRKKTAAM